MSFVSLNIEYFPDPTRGVPVYKGYVYVGEPDTDPEIPGNQVPVTLRLSDGSTVTAIQPIMTGAGGVALHNGSPVQVLVEGNYSLKVLDKLQVQVYYVANAFGWGIGDPLIGSGLLLVDLKALTPLSDAIVATSGRVNNVDQGGGLWSWVGTDLSTEVSLDPVSGVYTAPASDASGSSGAWMRLNVSQVNVKWFGAVGDGITDDTDAIQAALNLYQATEFGCLFFPEGVYVVGTGRTPGTVYSSHIFDVIDGVNGFHVKGYRAKIRDVRSHSVWGGVFSAVFRFDDSTNLSIKGLDYESLDTYVAGDLTSRVGYYGFAYLMFLGNCSNIAVEVNLTNARYGIKTGDHGTYTFNGTEGVTNLRAKITGEQVGYSLAVEHGSNIVFDLTIDTFHRVAYLAGVKNVEGFVAARNQYGAPTYVLISSSRYDDAGTEVFIGSQGVRVTVRDTGSTAPIRDSSLFGLQFYEFTGATPTRISDLELVGSVPSETTSRVQGLNFSSTSARADVVENVRVSFVTLAASQYTPFRISTYDDNIVRNFVIYNTLSESGTLGFTLGAGTTIHINSTKLYLIVLYESGGGGKIYVSSSYVYDIKSASSGLSVGSLYLENKDNVFVVEHPADFTLITYSDDFVLKSGATVDRPTNANIGFNFFDETLNIPVWKKTSSVWVDSSGTAV